MADNGWNFPKVLCLMRNRVPFPHFVNERYYPVDMEAEIIYRDPKVSERACCAAPYADHDVIGVSGRQLNQVLAYRAFTISDPLRH